MENIDGKGTILGIDIGPNSIGWALLETENKRPLGLAVSGVRVFEAGLENLEKDGRGVSRGAGRREARSRRRQLFRHTQRLKNLAETLQQAGLLPEGNLRNSEARHEILNQLDQSLKIESPYHLRARALDEKLEPFELGRALYHLCQRRGFLSNRKAAPKKDEKPGEVQKGINELQQAMDKEGARTLGEYFSKIDPQQERIRQRYTRRKMFENEFEKIWEQQKEYYPQTLTDSFKKNIYRAIFYQRPLKSAKHLIGRCSLEEGRRRAPMALLEAQRFRYLQRVNDLRITQGGKERPPAPEEREILIAALETEGDLTFSKIKKKLGLPREAKLNLEAGGEERIPGNRTAAKLIKVFGEDRWEKFSEKEREAVIEDLRSINKDETMKKRALKVWGLDEIAAQELCGVKLDQEYCAFSRRALKKLLPRLTEGIPLQTAIKELYPQSGRQREPKDLLPPVNDKEFPDMRNPIVQRALTELRKVVNHVIRTHGKPMEIRLELARDLKQTADQRENAWKKMRLNERERKSAAAKILEEIGNEKPSRDDILKIRLYEECKQECPYTGKGITISALLGEHPQFDIEHIIPFDRSLDDSFVNKTLCYAEENRNRKRNRTPYEAYHGTDKWEEIIQRVEKFKGDAKDEKSRRFQLDDKGIEEFLKDFTSRQLNDTRYASVWARGYLGSLYGCPKDDGVDPAGKLRVQVSSGQTTAFFRGAWGLNALLGDGPGKARTDHRHHAVDALVVALTDTTKVKLLSEAAKRAPLEKRRFFARMEPPWEGFREAARQAVKSLLTSHRVSKKVRGALHKDTFYGKPRTDENGKTFFPVRKPLNEKFSKDDVKNIVDKAIRECVRKKLEELGGDLKKFKDPNNHPYIEIKKGGKVPIHKVRIRSYDATFPVGKDHRTRLVESKYNHHIEVFKDLKTGKWDGKLVSFYEAHQRLRQKEPIIKRDHGEGKEFVFSLAKDETIKLENEDKTYNFYVVKGLTTVKEQTKIYPLITFLPINDARNQQVIIAEKGYRLLLNPLRGRKCRKVTFSPLGEIRYAND